jgi:hypothetical protein
VRVVIGILGIMVGLVQAASAASATACYKATFLEFNSMSSNATIKLSNGKKETWHILGGGEQVAVFNWKPLDVVTVCASGVDGISTVEDPADTTDSAAHAREVPTK